MNAPVRKKSYADADVADPTIILNHSDSNLVERWEDRKKRAAAAAKIRIDLTRPQPQSIKPLKSGKPIDREFEAKLRRLYADETMPVKAIAIQLGCGIRTVNRVRKELGIAPRLPAREGKPRDKVEISMWISPAQVAAIDKHIYLRFRNRSAYFRSLVRRDLGL